MNQYQWTFLDHAARRHTLGIAHGERSGNLVVHCNAQIVKVDFRVLEPRTYSFFVEDELCHLAIEGTREEGFQYNFHIDTEVDTALNRERRLKRISARRQGWAVMSALVLFVSGVIGGACYWAWSETQATLQQELIVTGVPASAKLHPDGTFEFVGGNRVVDEAAMPYDAERLSLLDAGAVAGVPVRYAAEKPHKFVVDWRALFADLEAHDTPQHPATAMLLEGLAAYVPAAAGTPTCGLRAAGELGNYRNQIAFIDAWLGRSEAERTRWAATVETSAYAKVLREVCTVGKAGERTAGE